MMIKTEILNIFFIAIITSLFLLNSCNRKEESENKIVKLENEKECLTWLVANAAPLAYVENGIQVGYGIEMIKWLQTSLPQYEHKIRFTPNYKRLISELSYREDTVAIDLIKTEGRKKFLEFAEVPTFYFFNMQIVMKESLFNKMNKPETLSLEKLLQLNHILGISKGRSYPKELNIIIEKYQKGGTIYEGAYGDVATTLLHMLDGKKIDIMLMYPEEALFLSKEESLTSSIVTVPIDEAKQFGLSWIATSKTDSGKDIMTNINRVKKTLKKMHSSRTQNRIDHKKRRL